MAPADQAAAGHRSAELYDDGALEIELFFDNGKTPPAPRAASDLFQQLVREDLRQALHQPRDRRAEAILCLADRTRRQPTIGRRQQLTCFSRTDGEPVRSLQPIEEVVYMIAFCSNGRLDVDKPKASIFVDNDRSVQGERDLLIGWSQSIKRELDQLIDEKQRWWKEGDLRKRLAAVEQGAITGPLAKIAEALDARLGPIVTDLEAMRASHATAALDLAERFDSVVQGDRPRARRSAGGGRSRPTQFADRDHRYQAAADRRGGAGGGAGNPIEASARCDRRLALVAGHRPDASRRTAAQGQFRLGPQAHLISGSGNLPKQRLARASTPPSRSTRSR